MESEHFLIKKAHIYDENSQKEPENCTYNEKIGLWVWNKNNEVLVKSNHPNRPNPMTKKQDVERIEDQK